jgi:hypothetical protein
VPNDSVRVNLGAGRASLNVADRDVEDYGTIVNALLDGPSVPANVSFRIEWSGENRVADLIDPVNRFTGRYIENSATIEWSAREEGFTFVSDPAETTTTEFALIGRERNGVFFHG